MNVGLRVPRMTRDQFLDWVEQQDAPYEFDGFEPVPMTGGNNRHTRLCRDLTFLLMTALAGSAFEVMPEGGIATVGDAVRYPDIVVAPLFGADGERLVVAPIVVVEVLSPSSGRVDRVTKLREYRAVASIRRYLIVDNAAPDVAVFARDDATSDWTATAVTAGEVLHLPEIGIQLAVDDIFRRVAFDPDPGP